MRIKHFAKQENRLLLSTWRWSGLCWRGTTNLIIIFHDCWQQFWFYCSVPPAHPVETSYAFIKEESHQLFYEKGDQCSFSGQPKLWDRHGRQCNSLNNADILIPTNSNALFVCLDLQFLLCVFCLGGKIILAICFWTQQPL